MFHDVMRNYYFIISYKVIRCHDFINKDNLVLSSELVECI